MNNLYYHRLVLGPRLGQWVAACLLVMAALYYPGAPALAHTGPEEASAQIQPSGERVVAGSPVELSLFPAAEFRGAARVELIHTAAKNSLLAPSFYTPLNTPLFSALIPVETNGRIPLTLTPIDAGSYELRALDRQGSLLDVHSFNVDIAPEKLKTSLILLGGLALGGGAIGLLYGRFFRRSATTACLAGLIFVALLGSGVGLADIETGMGEGVSSPPPFTVEPRYPKPGEVSTLTLAYMDSTRNASLEVHHVEDGITLFSFRPQADEGKVQVSLVFPEGAPYVVQFKGPFGEERYPVSVVSRDPSGIAQLKSFSLLLTTFVAMLIAGFMLGRLWRRRSFTATLQPHSP